MVYLLEIENKDPARKGGQGPYLMVKTEYIVLFFQTSSSLYYFQKSVCKVSIPDADASIWVRLQRSWKLLKTVIWYIGEGLSCRSSCVINYACFKNDLQNVVWILYEDSTALIFIKATPLFFRNRSLASSCWSPDKNRYHSTVFEHWYMRGNTEQLWTAFSSINFPFRFVFFYKGFVKTL